MKFEALSDSELTLKVQEGEHEAQTAFSILYDRWEKRVYSRAYKILGSQDDAREVVQEAFLSFYREVSKGKVIDSPGHYLMRITSNKSINLLQQTQNRSRILNTMAVDEVDSPEKQHDKSILGKALEAALNKLTPRLRLIALQKYVEDMSVRAIAEENGRSERMINYRLRKIRKVIARQVEEQGISLEDFAS